MNLKVNAKWGFGMAPTKPHTQTRRMTCAENVLNFIRTGTATEAIENDLSEVKGWFSRVFRQDQWDWFTVFDQLGRPGIKKSVDISQGLYRLRSAVLNKSDKSVPESIQDLKNLDIVKHLEVFLSGNDDPIGAGQIYVLSCREFPDYLKIGYTTRSVTQRVNEINGATGLMIPFGVRAVWRVKDAPDIEKLLHTAFAEYRVRSDREFFQMKFGQAFEVINDLLRIQRIGEI